MSAASAPRLVLAGLSVRAAAQAAQRDGFAVTGLDLFGDADTRAACAAWRALALRAGEPWQIDLASLRPALTGLAADEVPPTGLAIGAGFEADALALARLPLPWLGTAPEAIAHLRNPALFFDALDAYGIAHPAVSFTPVTLPGWLRKDFGTGGGWQVQAVDQAGVAAPARTAQTYWQQRVPGEPLSLTLLADGQHAVLLGLNRQLLAPTAVMPYRFGGLIGPLPWSGALQTRLQGMADRLVPHFGLRGLCAIDLLRATDPLADDNDALLVLEINPRLPASLALYGPTGGLMQAHVEACVHGHLPQGEVVSALRGREPRGFRIVHLEEPLQLDAQALQRLQALAPSLGLHDVPALPSRMAAGQPLCTVSAHGVDVGAVAQALERRRANLLQVLHLSSDSEDFPR